MAPGPRRVYGGWTLVTTIEPEVPTAETAATRTATGPAPSGIRAPDPPPERRIENGELAAHVRARHDFRRSVAGNLPGIEAHAS